jgi:alpha-tubulin suppressor-like RCC1 family protein
MQPVADAAAVVISRAMRQNLLRAVSASQGSGRWAALSFGARHSVGVSGDGEVYTWGRNDSAQLGHNALHQQPMPMRLSVLRGIDVKAISCGSSVRSCLCSDPCWAGDES